MQDLLLAHKLKLFYTRHKTAFEDKFDVYVPDGVIMEPPGWSVSGQWHITTSYTNVDNFLGIGRCEFRLFSTFTISSKNDYTIILLQNSNNVLRSKVINTQIVWIAELVTSLFFLNKVKP